MLLFAGLKRERMALRLLDRIQYGCSIPLPYVQKETKGTAIFFMIMFIHGFDRSATYPHSLLMEVVVVYAVWILKVDWGFPISHRTLKLPKSCGVLP
jgi:hypothetical protein